MRKEVELGKVKHKCEFMGDDDLQVDIERICKYEKI